MDIMFWVWLAVIIGTVILEIITTDLVSIWFTFGAILPCILSVTSEMHYGWQIVIFFSVAAVLIACLRRITLKFLFKNTNTKTNLEAFIGQRVRLLEKTDFETKGKVKIKDVEWTAVGDKDQTIRKGAIVEIVNIAGNKLLVKEVKESKKEKTNNN